MSQQRLYLCILVLVAITTRMCFGMFAKDIINSITIDVKGKDDHQPKEMHHKADFGYLRRCESENPPFLMSWSPKNIILGQNLTVNFSFILPVDVSYSHVKMSVGMPDYPYPLLEQQYDISCDNIRQFKNISCPLRKGERITIQNYSLKYLTKKIVDGQFRGRINVTNERGELVICAQGTANITDDSPYSDYYDYL